MFEPLDTKTTLRDSVVDRIRQAIFQGQLRPGDNVNQAQIATELGVSRGPVREALLTLEQEGLIENIPYRGTFVTKLTPEGIQELYSIRRILESFAVKLAITNATATDKRAIRAVIHKMEAAADTGNLAQTVEYDLQFHKQLVKAARHNLLLKTWESMATGVRLCLVQGHRAFENPRDTLGTHPDILVALEAGNATEATRLLEEHIIEAEQAILKAVIQDTNRQPEG